MADNNQYQQRMEPWPGLEALGKTTQLPDLGIDLYYFESGDPEDTALILLHGLGDEADTWRHVITPLAEKYHVLAVDLPGFGRSSHPKRAYTPDLMMKAVLELMDELGIEQAILVGSSLGGILSQGLAVTQPERVCGMVLVDGALLQPEAMGDRGLRLMQIPLLGEWLYTRLRKDPDAAFDSLRIVYHDLDGLPETDREFLYTRVNKRVWSDEQRRAYFSTLRHLTPWVKRVQEILPNRLADLDIPTLVVRGKHDQLFPANNANAIQEAQHDVVVATLEAVNHLPQQEDPQAFLAVVQDWLSRKFR